MQKNQYYLILSKESFDKSFLNFLISKKKYIKQCYYVFHCENCSEKHYHIFFDFGEYSFDCRKIANFFEIPVGRIHKHNFSCNEFECYMTQTNTNNNFEIPFCSLKEA